MNAENGADDELTRRIDGTRWQQPPAPFHWNYLFKLVRVAFNVYKNWKRKINKISFHWFASLFERRSGNACVKSVAHACVGQKIWHFAEVFCCLWRWQPKCVSNCHPLCAWGLRSGHRGNRKAWNEIISIQILDARRKNYIRLCCQRAYICFIQRKKHRGTHIHHPSCEQRLAHAFLLECLKRFFRPSYVDRSESNVCVCGYEQWVIFLCGALSTTMVLPQ